MCQFLVLAGNRQFFCCGGKVLLRPEKKVLVVCLAGCAVVSVLVLAGNRQFFCCGGKVLLRPEKKSSSRLSGGLCCCVSFWFWRLRPEKKRYSRLSGSLCCCVSFWFWRLQPEKKVTVICLAGFAVVSVFGSGDYDRKKKVPVVIKFVLVQLQYIHYL